MHFYIFTLLRWWIHAFLRFLKLILCILDGFIITLLFFIRLAVIHLFYVNLLFLINIMVLVSYRCCHCILNHLIDYFNIIINGFLVLNFCSLQWIGEFRCLWWIHDLISIIWWVFIIFLWSHIILRKSYSISDWVIILVLSAHFLGVHWLTNLLTVLCNIALIYRWLWYILMTFWLCLRLFLALLNTWLLIALSIWFRLHELFVIFAKVNKFTNVFGFFDASCAPQRPLAAWLIQGCTVARLFWLTILLIDIVFDLILVICSINEGVSLHILGLLSRMVKHVTKVLLKRLRLLNMSLFLHVDVWRRWQV